MMEPNRDSMLKEMERDGDVIIREAEDEAAAVPSPAVARLYCLSVNPATSATVAFPLAQNSIFSPESAFFAHYLKISEALLAARHVISADVISCFLECFCAETPKKR